MASHLKGRERRKVRIRKRVSGTAERPRLTVFRSARHIYAQVIDDTASRTLAAVSSLHAEIAKLEGDKSAVARAVGAQIGVLCAAAKIARVVFDRNGYIYHGRVQALADGARASGLEF